VSTYVLLLNYTEEGMRNIKYLPDHASAIRQAVEAGGGRMPLIYLVMGQYDLMAIIEAPSDEACASISLAVCSAGNLRSNTMKVFGEEDFDALVKNISSLEDEFTRILSQFNRT